MDLQTAGMISGAGNAGTQALQTMQTGLVQERLLKARYDLEGERDKFHEEMAMAREGRQAELQKGLLASREAGEESRHARTLAAQEANVGQQITSSEAMKTAELGTTERIHAEDRAAKQKLADQEFKLKRKYYDALAEYYTGRNTATAGRAASAAAGKEAPVDKKQKEYLESVTKPLIDNLSQRLYLAGPDEREEIQAQIDQITNEARKVAGIDIVLPTPGKIKDRFAPQPQEGLGFPFKGR